MLEGTVEPTEICIGANHVQVKAGDRTLTSKLIDGRFPDYERIMMQKGDKVVVTEREPLRQALARVSIISSEKFRGVRIALESDLLRASSHNAEREEAEEEIEVDYTGEPLEIGFNVTYLQDALSVIQTERVRLEFLDSKSSCLIRPVEGGGGTHVVMPIRL
jgi:DNA polymerase-3 subunit beta